MALLCIVLWTIFLSVNAQFEVPDAKVEVFSPRGLRVSIPDVEGIKLFAFHGKINEEFNGREAGTFARDIVSKKNGRWTFYEPTAKLNIGDVLYFWTYVDYFDGERKLGYPRDDQSYKVESFNEKEGDCKVSKTKVEGVDGKLCSGKIIFEEQFENFNESRWNKEIKFADSPDYEFVVYGDDPKVLYVNNEQLNIRPTDTDSVYGEGTILGSLDLGSKCTDKTSPCYRTTRGQFIVPPVASAQINTKGKFAFTYGKVEIRARLPKGEWLYPELYLNSESHPYGADYLSGQMRIAYCDGSKIGTLQGGIVLGDTEKCRKYGMKNKKMHTREFHNYGLVWSPEKITLSLNGENYAEITPPADGFGTVKNILTSASDGCWDNGSDLAPFDKPMHITIGVGAGGFNFPDGPDKPWRNVDALAQKTFYDNLNKIKSTWTKNRLLEVEHVKVWAL